MPEHSTPSPDEAQPSRAMLDRLPGCLLGLAVGDALGLPYEGLSRRRILRIRGSKPLKQEFVLGRGMFSDDTEHASMTLQAWHVAKGDVGRFAQALGWKLRWWLAALPPGTGFATLRAILKLWVGFPPEKSGVFSAGNGPCMRAPVLALVVPESKFEAAINACTTLTHTDPKAFEGAILVARAVRMPLEDPLYMLRVLREGARGEELQRALELAAQCLRADAGPDEFADRMGLTRGVSGYVNHTVPCALYCWLRHVGDFRQAVESVIRLGGDTDTTAAITGSLAGAHLGVGAIPEDWVCGLADWPRSRGWLMRLSESSSRVPLAWPCVPLRNALFLCIVLLHALRRAFPPYG